MTKNLQNWVDIAPVTIAPGYRARFIHSVTMTFALWDVESGAPLPEHSHPHEQVTHLLEGEFEITVDGLVHRMKAGDVLVIASHAVHSGVAVTACQILDVFSPVREDYVLDIGHNR